MRLTELTLRQYGNYEAETIRFDPAAGKVNILLAPNSAGKSVLRNAVADLLFGIPMRSEMDFRFAYAGMRVSATVLRRDGSETLFHRRKTRGNVVTDRDDVALDPTFLADILRGRDRKLLERLFVLDTEALRRGGADLLESGGDVASALLSAAGGIRQARALRQTLEQWRDELAPERRTSSRPFYQALDRFQEARRRAAAETINPDAWSRQEQELERLRQRQREHNVAADAASADIARLERIRRVRRWLAQHADATAWLEANPDAPVLLPEHRSALDQARRDVAVREEAERVARIARENAEQGANDVTVNAELLALGPQIKAVVGSMGQARGALDDRPGVTADHALGLTRIADLLRQLGLDLPPERAAEALPTRVAIGRARRLINEYAERGAAVRDAPARLRARERELADSESRLATCPPARDVGKLERLVEQIRAGGDPEARRNEADALVAKCDADLAAALARVPAWPDSAETLVELRPPAMEVWRRLDGGTATKRNELAIAERQLDDAAAALEQARAALASLTHGEAVADDAALRGARSHRDSGWKLIYRLAFASDPPTESETRAFAADVPLPLAFERAMADADRIADRRLADSSLLGRIEAGQASVARAELAERTAAERARLARETFAAQKRLWTSLCLAQNQPENSELSDIQTFLNARDLVIEGLRQRALAHQALGSLTARQDAWTTALAEEIGEATTALSSLLARADEMIAHARQQRQERTNLEASRDRAAKELRDARSVEAAAQAALDAWRERWRAALFQLGRPPTDDPADTQLGLETIGEIEKQLVSTNALADRITQMSTFIDRFTRSVQELRHALPALSLPPDPFETVRELDRLLNNEQALDQQQRMLREAHDKARVAHETASGDLTTAHTSLNAILSVIGAETIDAAERRLALSDERSAHAARRDEAETALRESGDGRSIEDLRAEAARHSADEDTAKIEAAAAARKEASDAAQKAAEEASRLHQSMEQKAGDTAVNAAAADQQAAIASLSQTLDQALLYHTASVLLSRALDTVERSGGSAMLRGISAIFQTLTGGLYDRVSSEQDDTGKADLVMIQRDFPDERQSIGQLSEGTRDQLFLALRVAAIEDHLTSAEPLPFIGDDILQSFDDDRALAALQVLIELSQHTQVILLTHHRHVLELASRLPDGAVFRCEREPAAMTA